MTDKDFVLAVLSTAALLVAIFFPYEDQPLEKFEVVDKYKGCEIVRYTDSSTRWHYFLDCSGR